MAFKQQKVSFEEIINIIIFHFYQIVLYQMDKQKGVNCSCCGNHDVFESPMISSIHLFIQCLP